VQRSHSQIPRLAKNLWKHGRLPLLILVVIVLLFLTADGCAHTQIPFAQPEMLLGPVLEPSGHADLSNARWFRLEDRRIYCYGATDQEIRVAGKVLLAEAIRVADDAETYAPLIETSRLWQTSRGNHLGAADFIVMEQALGHLQGSLQALRSFVAINGATPENQLARGRHCYNILGAFANVWLDYDVVTAWRQVETYYQKEADVKERGDGGNRSSRY